jgi:hypothetical protein
MWEDQQWSGEENWSGAGNNASWWGNSEYGSGNEFRALGDFREPQNFWQAYPDGYPQPFAQGDEGKTKERRQKFT